MRRLNLFHVLLTVVCIITIMFICPLAAKEIKEGNEIRIGVIGPMAFTPGEGHWRGAILAAEEINAKGGVKIKDTKHRIELVKVDSNEFRNVIDATNATERAITYHKVNFLTGGVRTEAVMAMQDIAMDYKVIFLGSGAAHPNLCQRLDENYGKYKYWFRIAPPNSLNLGSVNNNLLEMVGNVMMKELKIPKIRVAIIADKIVAWDPIVPVLQKILPEKMGMDVVGVWRPSPAATDLTAELSAIQRSDAHIIFTLFTGEAGIPFAKQWGELKIPACPVGINTEAQKDVFWETTGGKGNYTLTQSTFARVKITGATIPFFDKYRKRFGEVPPYHACTYDAIYILCNAIERAETLDTERLVTELEKTDYLGAAGRTVFTKNHDVTWGPGYRTEVGVQWQDGENKCVWPFNWKGVTYEGTGSYKIPPWVVKFYKK
jgi:branched-chain amino acid transport system substrate-binding protein